MNTHSAMSLLLMDLMKIGIVLLAYGSGIILTASLKPKNGESPSVLSKTITYFLGIIICAGFSFFMKTNQDDPIINSHSIELFALTTIPCLYGIAREYEGKDRQKA